MLLNSFSKLLVLANVICIVSSFAILPTDESDEEQVSLVEEGVYRRCVQNGTIALTYDDGPNPTRTLEVLEVLREKEVTAAFFINGLNGMDITSPEAKAIVKRTFDEGHLIGSHCWIHRYMINQTVEELNYNIVQLEDKVNDIIEKRITHMRPPYGAHNETVDEIVIGQLGYKMILWSISARDTSHPGDTEAGVAEYARILNGTNPATTPGYIALNHDPQRGSAELATAVIDYVRSIGYRTVSLEECLGL